MISAFHRLGARDEIGGNVAAVKFHTFHVLGLEVEALALLNRDDAVLTDFVHHVGNQSADFLILGADRGDLGDLVVLVHAHGHILQLLDDLVHARVDAVLDEHRVRAGGNQLQALVHNNLGQNGRGGGAVAGDVVRLGGGFLQELRAHVLERVGQFNFLGNGHAVVGDRGGAVFLVQKRRCDPWGRASWRLHLRECPHRAASHGEPLR